MDKFGWSINKIHKDYRFFGYDYNFYDAPIHIVGFWYFDITFWDYLPPWVPYFIVKFLEKSHYIGKDRRFKK